MTSPRMIFIDAVGIRTGGGAAILNELLYWLPRTRAEWMWRVFVLPHGERECEIVGTSPQVEICEVSAAGSPLRRLDWVCRRLPRMVSRERPAALFAMANLVFPWIPVPKILMCHQSVPFAVGHLGFPVSLRTARLIIFKHLMLLSASKAEAVVVQTEQMRLSFASSSWCRNAHIHVVPSGYRTAGLLGEISPGIDERLSSISRPWLTYISLPAAHKNHTTLVEALFQLRKSIPTASLLLTLEMDRTNSPEYSRCVAEIVAVAKRLDVLGAIHFLGTLPPQDVMHILKSCDVHVYPSLAESFGLPLAESVAAGCPVAASNLPYAREVLGTAAVYFDPHSPLDMARVITECLCNQMPDKAFHVEEYRDLRRRYSYSSIAATLCALIETIASCGNSFEASRATESLPSHSK
jgi:glycosyltransferase involved in cell wall biosynthesis